MKVAFLFAGQYRYIPKKLFKNSLSTLTKGLEYDIFCFSWDEIGESLDHRENVPYINNNNDVSVEKVSNIFEGFNLKKIETESYKKFNNNLPIVYKKILNSSFYHQGTIFALPQIYAISKCYKLLAFEECEYDLIFRCRFDSLYIHPLNLYPLEKFKNSSILYNINFGRAYYPLRVYDIFFGGSKRSMEFLDHIWINVPKLIKNNFNNGLDKRDACRLIYLSAISNKIKIKTLRSRICDVYRPSKDNYYEKYILSSHLLSIRIEVFSLKIIPYIIKWFIFRKINFIKLLLLIIKSILLVPFSYIKRLIYFFDFKRRNL